MIKVFYFLIKKSCVCYIVAFSLSNLAIKYFLVHRHYFVC